MHTVDPFRTLYDANHERVRRLLARVVGPQESEDLTQMVFARAAKGLSSFRGDAETSTWLYRIASNVASDWLRSRSAHEAKLTVQLPEASDDDGRTAVIGAADVDSHPSAEQQPHLRGSGRRGIYADRRCPDAARARPTNLERTEHLTLIIRYVATRGKITDSCSLPSSARSRSSL